MKNKLLLVKYVPLGGRLGGSGGAATGLGDIGTGSCNGRGGKAPWLLFFIKIGSMVSYMSSSTEKRI